MAIPSDEDLKLLPRHAAVAFAARVAVCLQVCPVRKVKVLFK